MNRNLKSERRLRLACEISAGHVIAARASEDGQSIDVCTVRTLAPGSVSPGLTNVNVTNHEALATGLGDAMATVGSKQKDVILVIPDAACRVSLLDFDELPAKSQEAESVVRFRLKKSLPFEVESARLSYEVHRVNGSTRVIATVALPSVVEEYELAVRRTGFLPGVVVPSTLAALGLVDASRPTLIMKIASESTGMAVVNDNDLLLFRTVENPVSGVIDPEQLAEDIYPSLVFFQDTYGLKIERILIGGAPSSFDSLAEAIEKSTAVRPRELVPQHELSSAVVADAQRPIIAGIMGALIS
jgi:type IV pilus assembly protein PilM